jgi:predicted Fe-S protein YdhL (DUF1289 family)|tara:strand:+ start:363 stop:506 length:144 start_codon:yes stop_codon:yes gene_type:complete
MKIESPCIGVCELKDDVCIGCNRTIEEITNWVPISQEKKELKNALHK